MTSPEYSPDPLLDALVISIFFLLLLYAFTCLAFWLDGKFGNRR